MSIFSLIPWNFGQSQNFQVDVMKLNIEKLHDEAILFCEIENKKNHIDLIGITDGKAVGTYIEHEFQKYLKNKYDFTVGSSAKGIVFL
jgi:hypothetical protein